MHWKGNSSAQPSRYCMLVFIVSSHVCYLRFRCSINIIQFGHIYLQLDFQLPERFELYYSAEDEAKRERPVMIHRAILGSVERMFAILLEHYKGKWPFWLSPRQAIVCPVSEKSQSYALKVAHEVLLNWFLHITHFAFLNLTVKVIVFKISFLTSYSNINSFSFNVTWKASGMNVLCDTIHTNWVLDTSCLLLFYSTWCLQTMVLPYYHANCYCML